MKWFSLVLILSLLGRIAFVPSSSAEDWPMWRYDAGRTAFSPQQLPAQIHIQWMRKYPQPEPVWDDPLNRDLMQYDTIYEPIVLGTTLFLGFNGFDRMVALDVETGNEKWIFHTDGPVRLPPVGAQGKIYFVSDDGCLYCLNAENGELLWKYQSVPQNRLILGNERLISTWCARGGPVLKDGILYFGAGIWPFMGVFIFALDAESGEEIWVNDSSSAIFMKQPHNSPSFASVAPQGSFVISGDKLLVPGGRSVPACFDRKTGDFLYYRLAENGKTGGSFVAATDKHFINYYRDQVVNLYDTSKGDLILAKIGQLPVITPERFYSKGDTISALDYKNLRMIENTKLVKDATSNEIKEVTESAWVLDSLWQMEVDSRGDLIRAGDRLYAGGENRITAIDLPSSGDSKPTVSWQTSIEGTVSRIIAAADKLFVVTREGMLYALGEEKRETIIHPYVTHPPKLPEHALDQANTILHSTSIREGYCLVYGVTDGDLIDALVRQSDLRIIAFDPDPTKVDRLRRRFTEEGLYGKRISILTGDLLTEKAPPYIASLTIFEDGNAARYNKDREFFTRLYRQTRPYGGIVYLKCDPSEIVPIRETLQQCELPNAKIYPVGETIHLVRAGALPDSADWTHQYGNIANTVKSDDRLVKLPLGLLWFGGSSNLDVLPRHGHGPPEQIVGGRLFIQGMNSLSARDVYTGRVLWKQEIPNLDNYGVYYDDTYKDMPLSTEYNQIHIPGANSRGTNYIVTTDKVYIVTENRCLVLDPDTGQIRNTFELPLFSQSGQPNEWGYIGVYEEYLIAGAGMVRFTDFLEIDPEIEKKKRPFYNFDNTSSKRLVVMNRHTGKVLWTYDSSLGLRHNAIAAGNGKLYCIDKIPETIEQALKRRGNRFTGTPRLLAFDIPTGNILWSRTEDIFGTWLSYSDQHDVLIEAVRSSRDMIAGEPKEKMAAFQGQTGHPLWKNDATYGGPCILHGKTIITEPHAYHLLTGKQIMRRNPLTGEETPWAYNRQYGCNYSIASEYMMTFRSAAAGFFDLEQDAGTGNFGGFKSGCTSNLIAANGVLNAPDYTRTCSCSYQNQTSLALIHDPEVEIWTYNSIDLGKDPIQRLGINLGAPGDRRVNQGTLWLEYPIVGGPSPEIDMQILPTQTKWFRSHSSRMSDGEMEWIAASGAQGLRYIKLTLADGSQGNLDYTVRLYFAEPESLQPGERVFDITLQGKTVLAQFDIVQESGSSRRGIVKQFDSVQVNRQLVIGLKPTPSSPNQDPVLCGVEILLNHPKTLQTLNFLTQ